MSEFNGCLLRSCQRMLYLLGPGRAPKDMVDHEAKLLVGRLALLIGPDVLRRWVDEAVNKQLDALSGPTAP